MASCIFCAIVAGEAPARVIDDDERTIAFMDISPITHGHALVIPRQHARDLLDVDPDDLAAMARTAQRVARAAVDGLGAEGVNLLQATGALAWQTVFHIHIHVLPRFGTDGLRLPFVERGASDDSIEAAASTLRGALSS